MYTYIHIQQQICYNSCPKEAPEDDKFGGC